MAKGFSIAEEGHVVNILPPIDIAAGAVVCVPVNMECYQHCSIILQSGVNDNARVVTVQEVATVGGVGVAIGFTYYAETTALGDTLGVRTAVGAGGFAMSLNDNTMYVIEIEASDLSDGFNYVELNIAAGGAANLASAVAVLSGSRYASDASGITAIV